MIYASPGALFVILHKIRCALLIECVHAFLGFLGVVIQTQRLHRLVIRNMADEGNTPGFRPHSGRPSPWAFPGAEAYYPPLSEAKDRWGSGHTGHGTYDSPDAWLTRLSADVIIAFFGYNASFNGAEGLEAFKDAL